ncbi:MAG: glycosyltransferase family 4 protein [bacterium]
MKILIVSPYLPRSGIGHGGGLVIYNLLRHLGPRHRITLLSFLQHPDEAAHLGEIEPYVERIRTVVHDFEHISKAERLRNVLSPDPSFTVHLTDPAFLGELKRLISTESFDIVQLEYLFLAHYARHIQHPRIVLDLIECFGRHWRGRIRNERLTPRQAYFRFDWWKAERFERSIIRHFRKVFTLTDEDRAWLLARCPDLPIHVRLPGVDLPELATIADRPRKGILFVGSFKHPANHDGLAYFLKEVFPRIRATRPETVLTVVGAPAPREFESVPGVDVRGFVDDLEPVYRAAQLCIAPIRFGGGIKTKVLEALAHEVPVVTTPLGAEGIGASDGRELVVAKGAAEFASQTVELLDDPARCERMGKAGRRLVATRYAWQPIIDELDAHYRDLLGETADVAPVVAAPSVVTL